jgi:drug/metabolite transporter (DMT)-like permease
LPVVLAYVVCALVWGTTWFAIRVCLRAYPVFEAAALRFAIASVVLIAIVKLFRVRGGPTSRAQWGWLAVAGVLDAIGYSLVYLGETRVPGGLAAVLYAVQPLFLALALAVTRMEPVRLGAVLGAMVSIAGVAIIYAERASVSNDQAIGVAMVVCSVAASTAYSMVMKRHADGVHPLIATTIFIVVTAIVLGLAVLVRGPAPVAWPPPLGPTLALLYLAIFGSVIAFGTYFWLLRRLSLMAMSTLVFVLPLISLAVDAMFENQVRLTGRAYLGVAITLSGLAVNLLLERARRSAGTS